jgi:hypothetical protein
LVDVEEATGEGTFACTAFVASDEDDPFCLFGLGAMSSGCGLNCGSHGVVPTNFG